MIASFKGGVGKSTVAVNLAAGLAARGYKILIVDLDASSGSVDLFLGCEHDTVYNFLDVAKKRVGIKDAVYSKNVGLGFISGRDKNANINHSKTTRPSVDILKSPPLYDFEYECKNNGGNNNGEGFSMGDAVGEFIAAAKEIYDFVIFDCPSGKFELFDILAAKTDTVFVITLHSSASVRSAERLAASLSESTGSKGENVRLIINGFNPKGVSRGLNLGIVEIIERSKIKLIGLIGLSDVIRDLQESGKTVYDIKGGKISGVRKDFDDIAGRILDNNIKLSRKYGGFRTDSLYFKNEK
ncbi:MAG: AAA family ATPase [Oscillospiraceae bacterium]|nr:AAA family ATPase [Oscillospiraceae bacterium]